MKDNNKVRTFDGKPESYNPSAKEIRSAIRQYRNPDPEPLTVGQTAQQQHPNLMPARALLVWAFGLGFVERGDLSLGWSVDGPLSKHNQ